MMDASKPLLLALRYTPREKELLHARSLVTLVCMYGSLLAAAREPRLLWLAFVVNLLCSIRYTGYVHALNHAYLTSERPPFLLEALPAAFTPFTLGFTEFRRVHFAHHQYETRSGDPDNFLIAGKSKPLIFLKCMMTFEHWFFYALRRRWLSERFWAGYAIRLALLAALLLLSGPVPFVCGFLLPIKIGTGLSFYVFSYLTHVHHGKRGTFLLPLPPALTLLNRILIGRYAADPANIHTIHHQKPWISCAKLEIAQHLLQRQP